MPTAPPNVFLEFIARYGPPAGEEGPVRMAVEVFGAVLVEKPTPTEPRALDPWQQDVLRAYGRGDRGITVRACHGPGKTWVAGLCVIHQLLTRFPQKCVATAPSRAQLEDALVAEVMARFRELPPVLQDLFEVRQNRIELKAAPEESFFSARTARAESPEALQGIHSAHVLLIADEAPGVPEQIFNAAQGSMSGEHATTMLLGNPTRSSGFFYDTHRKPGLCEHWKRVRVSYRDSSRVTEKFALDVARRSGEDSNEYRIRVLGEFPAADDDTVIPWELIESAQNRDIVLPRNPAVVWALDVARFGNDLNTLLKRTNLAVLPDIKEWGKVDLMNTAGRVKHEWDQTPIHERPWVILVDVIGLGAGVVDRLRELGLPARGINVSETASASDLYRNLRSELWFLAREWLASRDHQLPKCPPTKDNPRGCPEGCLHTKLVSELAAVRFAYTSSGKIAVESKDEMKKRGLKSPNAADAFVLSFAGGAAALIHGSRGSVQPGMNWNEPIRRNRVRV